MSTVGPPGANSCQACASPLAQGDAFCRSCGTAAPPRPSSSLAPLVVELEPESKIRTTHVGQVAPPPPPGALPFVTTSEPSKRLRFGVIVGAAAAALVAGFLAYQAFSGDDGGGGTEEAAPTAVDADLLAPDTAVAVSLDDDTNEAARVHPLDLRRRSGGTVIVSANRGFEPQVALLTPNGEEVPLEGLVIGSRGVAVRIATSRAGQHSFVVSGFSPEQSAYTIEYRPDAEFAALRDLRVGDCVDRFDDEPWPNVSGFFVVNCNQPHDGQVLEQLPAAAAEGAAAQERCDAARHDRVFLPGYVNWTAYWGDGITCVIRSPNGSPLGGPVVRA